MTGTGTAIVAIVAIVGFVAFDIDDIDDDDASHSSGNNAKNDIASDDDIHTPTAVATEVVFVVVFSEFVSKSN